MNYILLLSMFFVFIQSNAQNNSLPQNKIYTREVGSSCKSFANGGCLITTFESMRFTNDSVYISQYSKAACDVPVLNQRYENSNPIGRYSYQVQKKKNSPNHIVRIDGYNKGSWELDDKQLKEINLDPAISKKICYDLTK